MTESAPIHPCGSGKVLLTAVMADCGRIADGGENMQGVVEVKHPRTRPAAPGDGDHRLPGGWWILPAMLTGLLAWGGIGELLWRNWPA